MVLVNFHISKKEKKKEMWVLLINNRNFGGVHSSPKEEGKKDRE